MTVNTSPNTEGNDSGGEQSEKVEAPITEQVETKGGEGAENTDKDLKVEEENKTAAPEKYEFKPPEGFETLDEGAIEQFTPLARELNLTQDQAQKLVDLYAKQMQSQQDAMIKQREDWAEEVKADKEIGGANLNQNIEHAKKAIDKFGSSALINLLEDSGLGNHPEVVRCFTKIGKAFSEDSFVSSNTAGAGNEKSAADVLYGNK